ncbi:hypothetical protein FSP39_019489 [Pinctada imbricata]|uniref:Peptidase M3A/M3B catalytic domain-containing protein n=1 Tax=Pinctada imbricata TaxID=66713 RepID=A0AA88YA21_PINIB|nr:hypothetical protein FSP39_019489 [Pinctada imbricata]
MADMVRVLHPDPKYNAAAEEVVIKLSGIVEQLNTNLPAYEALKNAMLHGDVVTLDDVDKRVGELLIMDFEQSGVHLDSDKKDLFLKLNESCVMLGNMFVQGAQTPVAVMKENLPEEIRHSFNIDGDNVLVTGLFQDHWNDYVREAAYRIYLHPIPQQTELLEGLLLSRHQLADLTGFPSFAHRALRGTLAETVGMSCICFIAMYKSITVNGEIIVVVLISLYARYSNFLRTLHTCNHLPVDLESGETWAHDVYKLAVVHSQEGVLGYIYCDFYERPGKPDQDCHFLIQGGRELGDGSYQLPVVVLKLTLPRPRPTCRHYSHPT